MYTEPRMRILYREITFVHSKNSHDGCESDH
jgi:hypothetical protein